MYNNTEKTDGSSGFRSASVKTFRVIGIVCSKHVKKNQFIVYFVVIVHQNILEREFPTAFFVIILCNSASHVCLDKK